MTKNLSKVMAIVVCFIFSFTTISWSAQAVYTITVPEKNGKVLQRYKGNEGKIIIHVQDAHSSFDAQKNLAAIICSLLPQLTSKTTDQRPQTADCEPKGYDCEKVCSLQSDVCSQTNKRNKVPFVGIEGAFGEYDLKKLREFPVEEAKIKVAEEYVKDGKFIGAELASIVAKQDFTLTAK